MKLGEKVLELVYPPRCVICGEAFSKEPVCRTCEEKLIKLDGSRYLKGTDFLHVACFAYSGEISNAVVRMKTERDVRALRYFSGCLGAAVQQHFDTALFDCVLGVPMAPRQRRERGFNHAEILAKYVAKELGTGTLMGVLSEDNRAQDQHSLTEAQRRENVRDHMKSETEHNLDDKVVLLVDDISTTGATMGRCGELLLSLGAKAVYTASICDALLGSN